MVQVVRERLENGIISDALSSLVYANKKIKKK